MVKNVKVIKCDCGGQVKVNFKYLDAHCYKCGKLLWNAKERMSKEMSRKVFKVLKSVPEVREGLDSVDLDVHKKLYSDVELVIKGYLDRLW